jgi:hypothetical protein
MKVAFIANAEMMAQIVVLNGTKASFIAIGTQARGRVAAEKIATMTAAMSTWRAKTSQKLQCWEYPMAAPIAAATTPTIIVSKQPMGWLFGTTIRATAPMMSPMRMAEKKPLISMAAS